MAKGVGGGSEGEVIGDKFKIIKLDYILKNLTRYFYFPRSHLAIYETGWSWLQSERHFTSLMGECDSVWESQRPLR